MQKIEIEKNIYGLIANLPPQHNGQPTLFEGLWEIPNGVSINAYAIKADKIALIDNIENFDDFPQQYENLLAGIGIVANKIDYLILNHLEPDHTGYLGRFAAKNPQLKIYCTAKAVSLLKNFYGIEPNQIVAVKTGDELDLGGRKLVFYEAPNVHWPETMVTFESNSGILFSCDAFGSFGKVEAAKAFADQNTIEELQLYQAETIRYYANIVASFSSFVKKALSSLNGLPLKVIAPSHGLLWRGDVSPIINLYQNLADYAENGGEEAVTLVWGSMYGNTAMAIDIIRQTVAESDLKLYEHRLPGSSSLPLAHVYYSKGLILAMPTYEYKMFPPIAHFINDLKIKHIKNKQVLRLGGYGWVGGAERDFRAATESAGWQIAPSIEWPGQPTAEVKAQISEAVRQLIKQIKGN
ncbi:MAG: FprA family A-type flavoprotein [Spirochaetaceae bacterium]|nr:FprA family A-type flavoprotein [Spirochaetaceae bacterium]